MGIVSIGSRKLEEAFIWGRRRVRVRWRGKKGLKISFLEERLIRSLEQREKKCSKKLPFENGCHVSCYHRRRGQTFGIVYKFCPELNCQSNLIYYTPIIITPFLN